MLEYTVKNGENGFTEIITYRDGFVDTTYTVYTKNEIREITTKLESKNYTRI